MGTLRTDKSDASVHVLSLRGEHASYGAHRLAEALAAHEAGRPVVIDLSECDFIDSTVVSVLVAAAREGRIRSVYVPASAPEGIRQLFELARLKSVLPVAETWEASAAVST